MKRDWLIDIRQQQRLKKAQVAKAVGISQPSYLYIENGTRRPSVETAKKIAAVLGFDWTRFFED